MTLYWKVEVMVGKPGKNMHSDGSSLCTQDNLTGCRKFDDTVALMYAHEAWQQGSHRARRQ